MRNFGTFKESLSSISSPPVTWKNLKEYMIPLGIRWTDLAELGP